MYSVLCHDAKQLFSKVSEVAERTYRSCLRKGPIFRELQNSVSLLQFPHLAFFRAI